MKLATAAIGARTTYGVVADGALRDLGAVLGAEFPDLKSLLAADALGRAVSAHAHAPTIALADLRFLPPIPNPDKILCVGLNYEMHREEQGRAEVAHPTIFARFANSQIGHREPMLLPALSDEFDFEGELALVIGRPTWRAQPEAALAAIAGFACYNDGSIRDWQHHSHQYIPGKNFPATGGFGPWLVTPDEFGPVGPQRIATRLNGETVQDARLSDMIFDLATIIAYCSAFTRLEPGDVIATGTPGGVGSRRTPKLWMRDGDRIEVEIDGIGILANPIVAEEKTS